MASSRRRSRRSSTSHRGRVALLVALGLVVILLSVGGLMAWQVWSAMRAAEAGNAAVTEFRSRLLERDIAGAESALEDAQEETESARSSLGGPLWQAATRLPAVGDDVTAARRLAVTADDVTHGALPAVMTALSYVDPREVGLRDGRVQLDPLRRASSQLTRAATLLRSADEDASDIRTQGLTPNLRARVVDTQDLLDRTSRLAGTVSVAGRLLPDMLGGQGSRDYVLVAQNPAEQRSLGGIAGAFVLLRADDGRLEVVRQADTSDIGEFQAPVLPLSAAEEALYGRVLGRFPANITDTPDFPRGAELLTQMWQERLGGEIDGVVAIDPWALQLLLQAVGPVETDAGRLTGRNATRTLLVDVYRDLVDPEAQDAAFAQAARRIFDRVRSFDGDPRALTSALADGVDQGRLMVWSARRREQAVLEQTVLGQTLRDPTPASPRVGVYLHNRLASKMSVYQRARIDVRPSSCTAPDSARVTVRLRSTAPPGAQLPDYVTGTSDEVPRGDQVTQVVVYAPPGWTIKEAIASDGREDLVTFRHDGLWAGTRDFRLAPGEAVDLSVEMSGARLSSSLGIRYTPGAQPANVRVEGSSCS